MSKKPKTKAGFVALIGAPNAGKSTLLNSLVGQKISIVTHKVQTTRSRIVGILTVEQSQIIFLDTPGIFKAREKFTKAMVQSAVQGQKDADITAFIYDVSNKRISEDNDFILTMLEQSQQRKILVLNKIDLIPRDRLLELAQTLNDRVKFEHTFMISALKQDHVQDLVEYFAKEIPDSEWLYPEDQISEMPLRLMAAETTREKVFLNLHQELPYNITVETEQIEYFENGDVKISQVIFVERENYKGIILGHKGQMIKRIGAQARKDLDELFEAKTHLSLFVKVNEKWKDKAEFYENWGLEFNA
jgi:GTPase